jgi:hypothetical protein
MLYYNNNLDPSVAFLAVPIAMMEEASQGNTIPVMGTLTGKDCRQSKDAEGDNLMT